MVFSARLFPKFVGLPAFVLALAFAPFAFVSSAMASDGEAVTESKKGDFFSSIARALFSRSKSSETSDGSEDPNATKGGTGDVPVAVERALVMLNKSEQPKFYGAYKAGFDKFEERSGDWFMLKKVGDGDGSTIPIVFIGSLKHKKTFAHGKYGSLISEVDVQCSSQTLNINRIEWKEDKFGTGGNVWAVSFSSEKPSPDGDQRKSITNAPLKKFILDEICG